MLWWTNKKQGVNVLTLDSCFYVLTLVLLELQGALSREREKCIQRIIGLLCQVYDAVSLFYAPCLVFFYPTIDLIFSARLGL